MGRAYDKEVHILVLVHNCTFFLYKIKTYWQKWEELSDGQHNHK
jgi:hypothetical protein